LAFGRFVAFGAWENINSGDLLLNDEFRSRFTRLIDGQRRSFETGDPPFPPRKKKDRRLQVAVEKDV
jgi:hypothetical protein